VNLSHTALMVVINLDNPNVKCFNQKGSLKTSGPLKLLIMRFIYSEDILWKEKN